MLTKHHPRARLRVSVGISMLSGAAAMIVAIGSAHAQEAAEEAQRASPLALEEIVVTGRAGGQGMRKLDASFAITTLSNFEIEKFSPKSTADLFKSVQTWTPGVPVETSPSPLRVMR